MAAGNEAGFVMGVIKFIQDGGVWMYPILVFFFIGIAIVLERWLYLQSVTSKNSKTWNELFPLLSKGQFKQALELAKNSNTYIGNIVSYGLARAAVTNNHEDIELAMEEGLMECIPRLEQRTNYVATIANVATLLGLLGTIIGLIDAFGAISSADPAQKGELLSSSISVAMNTTALGLIAAIPLLLSFTYLQSKTARVVDSMEMATVKFINVYRQLMIATEKKG
ncbi:MAG: MotA/TolQ/ExbB proton channel family protein [Pseudomonadota bacterium]